MFFTFILESLPDVIRSEVSLKMFVMKIVVRKTWSQRIREIKFSVLWLLTKLKREGDRDLDMLPEYSSLKHPNFLFSLVYFVCSFACLFVCLL